MQSSKNKITRYKNLVKHIDNWESYLLFKVLSKDEYFKFKLKDSFTIKVQRTMLSAFKESFLDDIYLRGFPDEILSEEKMNVIDIGANAGFFSLYMLYRFPKAKVFAFEPMPYNFSILEQYQKQYHHFDFNIYQKAVGAKNEKITLNTSKLDGYTTMASVFESGKKSCQIEVDAKSLDSLCKHHDLEHIDFLKLDCEGAEYNIIYNASKETLAKIKIMSIETHQGVKEDENFQALKTFLEKNNFQVNALDEGGTGYLWVWRA